MLKKDLCSSEKKLRALAKKHGIRVRLVPTKQLNGFWAWFDPETKTIKIKSHLRNADRSSFLFVIAHEIGHCIDDNDMKKRRAHFMQKLLHDAYHQLQNGCMKSKLAQMFILNHERSANKHAERIITDLNIPINHAKMKKIAGGCIRGYRAMFKKMGEHKK